MDGAIDQIKQKLDIVEVIGEYIRLTRAGRNYKARCPFHGERTPSFMVSQERQIWKCFGCGLGGDIFEFVKQIEGVEFGDALRILARRAGVVLKRQDPQVQSARKRLYEICELAARFFLLNVKKKSAPGSIALKYLLERGLSPETIKVWRLGWAPDEWRALSDFLKSRGYKESEMLQAGLIVEKTSGNPPTPLLKGGGGGLNYYDRFRSRIIFPIFDIQGQTIAFGGRIFGEQAKKDDIAKYVNSPQTPLYDKSRVLYGLHKTKTEIRVKDLCVIVEGYMDLLMSWQVGVTNVVASSGTALTEEHLKIIARYTKNLSMAFDADIAGEGATRRSIDLALNQDFYTKVILMKDKDPADVVKKDPKEWEKIVGSAQSVMDFYFTSTLARFNSAQLEGRREIKKTLLPVIKAISSKTEQSEWLRKLSQMLKADEKDLVYDLQGVKMPAQNGPMEKNNSPVFVVKNKTRLEGLEERILGLCLDHPQHLQKIPDVCEEDFQDKDLGQIFCELQKMIQKQQGQDPIGDVRGSLSPELKLQVEYLSLKIQQQPAEDLQAIAEIESCIKELKILKIRQQLTAISFDINDAQAGGNKTRLGELLDKFSQLSGELLKLTKEIV